MTCKDCVHYEACEISSVYFGEEKGSKSFREYEKRQNVELDCDQFKDKTQLVELPCKVGDILYEITERRIKSHWVKCIVRRVVLRIEVGLEGYISAKCGTTISVPLQNIGKTVFLTREEAEKALERSRE